MLFMVWTRRILALLGAFAFFTITTSFRPILPGEYGVKTVVIDAGHGGKDPGSIGHAKMQEKDVALAIALQTGEFIKKNHPDVKVVYTRDTDVFITLNGRAKKANDINADLFISIHADAAVNKAAFGTETFAMGLHVSKQNLALAKRENAVILMEDNYEVAYEGFDPNSDESYIAMTLRQNDNLAQSLSIADKVQKRFTMLGRKNRGVKQAGFIVLYKTTMPAILVENGFITNKDEGLFLSKQENRITMANAISEAFADYKTEIEDQLNALRGVNKKVEAPVEEKPKEQKPKEKKEKKEEPKEKVTEVPKKASETVRDNSNDVQFRVQIASSKNSIELTPENFKGLVGVQELKVGEVFKYTYGNAGSFEEGLAIQRKVKKELYTDAFLIAVYAGERISISKALELSNKKKTE
jgi:N-acetylmuramoyl-L-alanine amidase